MGTCQLSTINSFANSIVFQLLTSRCQLSR